VLRRRPDTHAGPLPAAPDEAFKSQE
jgi:hypothetical protein